MDSQEMNLRLGIVKVCQKLERGGLIAASDGNVSCRMGPDCVLITPGGVPKGDIESEDIAKTDMDGALLEGPLKPSSEIRMHLLVYQMRPDVSAIVHAHPPLSTAFTIAGFPFNSKVLPEVWLMLGKVPLAPYATPATDEVARSIEPYVAKSRAILLKRHGAVTFGRDLSQACMRMEKLEHSAKILFYASMLEERKAPSAMTEEEIAKLEAAVGARLV
ncbi:MAG: class II aldolase/adducin family protein [Syntrophobacteraceae bacterium]|nr:class II aldolase/adducin family protein [Syntrophobacteraceae bacterium]